MKDGFTDLTGVFVKIIYSFFARVKQIFTYLTNNIDLATRR